MPHSKFFLVEITSHAQTRWFSDDVAFASALCTLATGAVKIWTEGPEPEIGVRLIDGPTFEALAERGAVGAAIK